MEKEKAVIMGGVLPLLLLLVLKINNLQYTLLLPLLLTILKIYN